MSNELKIESHELSRIKDIRMEFIVTVYEDQQSERYYMATTANTGMSLGIGDTPYEAIHELCDVLDNLAGEDVEW